MGIATISYRNKPASYLISILGDIMEEEAEELNVKKPAIFRIFEQEQTEDVFRPKEERKTK